MSLLAHSRPNRRSVLSKFLHLTNYKGESLYRNSVHVLKNLCVYWLFDLHISYWAGPGEIRVSRIPIYESWFQYWDHKRQIFETESETESESDTKSGTTSGSETESKTKTSLRTRVLVFRVRVPLYPFLAFLVYVIIRALICTSISSIITSLILLHMGFHLWHQRARINCFISATICLLLNYIPWLKCKTRQKGV